MCWTMSVRNRPADFRLLHLTIHKSVFSILPTQKDSGEKAQSKLMFVSFFLGLQTIDFRP